MVSKIWNALLLCPSSINSGDALQNIFLAKFEEVLCLYVNYNHMFYVFFFQFWCHFWPVFLSTLWFSLGKVKLSSAVFRLQPHQQKNVSFLQNVRVCSNYSFWMFWTSVWLLYLCTFFLLLMRWFRSIGTFQFHLVLV